MKLFEVRLTGIAAAVVSATHPAAIIVRVVPGIVDLNEADG